MKYQFGMNLFEVNARMNHTKSEEEYQLRGKETLPLKVEKAYCLAKKAGLMKIESQEYFEAGTSQGEILMVKYSKFLTPEMVIPKVFEIEKESKYKISENEFDLLEALKKDSNYVPPTDIALTGSPFDKEIHEEAEKSSNHHNGTGEHFDNKTPGNKSPKTEKAPRRELRSMKSRKTTFLEKHHQEESPGKNSDKASNLQTPKGSMSRRNIEEKKSQSPKRSLSPLSLLRRRQRKLSERKRGETPKESQRTEEKTEKLSPKKKLWLLKSQRKSHQKKSQWRRQNSRRLTWLFILFPTWKRGSTSLCTQIPFSKSKWSFTRTTPQKHERRISPFAGISPKTED